jgi:hypothetical protein
MYTVDDIAALKRAIGTGALKVTYADGRATEFRSLREMRDILRMMEQDVASSTGSAASRSFVAGF